MYLKFQDVENGIFDGCNESEIKELLSRKSLEDWVIDTYQARQALNQYLDKLASQEDTRLIDMILKIAPIKNRAVTGTDREAFLHIEED